MINLIYNIVSDSGLKHFLILFLTFAYLISNARFSPIVNRVINKIDLTSHVLIIALVLIKQRAIATNDRNE